MANANDMGVLYAQNMEHFACGVAMYQPVSSMDMKPPCVGYLDSRREWNFIANIEWADSGKASGERPYVPLPQKPVKMEQIDIEWRPRTSKGVRQYVLDASGETPNIGIPAGADAHIKYKSNTSFGAVLIAQKPITHTSYNDEALFQLWLENNRVKLATLYGPQLRRYGLWLVTSTYAAPKCSINTWLDKDKEAQMSMKVKANMVGDLGGDLDWSDKMADKDWSHYAGKEKGDTVVVFFNGIEVPTYEWWWPSIKARISPGPSGRSSRNATPSPSRNTGNTSLPRRTLSPHSQRLAIEHPAWDEGPAQIDLWGSETPLRRASLSPAPSSRGRPSSLRIDSPHRPSSTLRRYSKSPAPDTEPLLNRHTSTNNHTGRLSTTSIATTSFSDGVIDPVETHTGFVSPTSSHVRELRRKISSPRLRSSS